MQKSHPTGIQMPMSILYLFLLVLTLFSLCEIIKITWQKIEEKYLGKSDSLLLRFEWMYVYTFTHTRIIYIFFASERFSTEKKTHDKQTVAAEKK